MSQYQQVQFDAAENEKILGKKDSWNSNVAAVHPSGGVQPQNRETYNGVGFLSSMINKDAAIDNRHTANLMESSKSRKNRLTMQPADL